MEDQSKIKAKCQMYLYSSDSIEIKKDSIKYFTKSVEFSKLDTSKVHWLNFHSLKDVESIEQFCLKQGFERLIIEDIFGNMKRPKLEEYNHYFFFSIRSALPTSPSAVHLNEEKISFILGQNYLISFQEKKSDHFIDVRDRLENKKGRVRDKAADFLLYRMLDAIMDNYFEVLDDISRVIDSLEGLVTRSQNHGILGSIKEKKRKLQQLRKIVMPL